MNSVFKKIMAITVSILFLIPVSFVTSYASYDPYDVNHDNSINMSDVVAISQFRSGNLYCEDYRRFDVNNSTTVDIDDEQEIQAYLLGYSCIDSNFYSRAIASPVSFPNTTGFIPEGNITSTTGVSYRRYSYTNHQELPSYTLNPTTTSLSLNASNNTDNIVDDSESRYRCSGAECTGLVYIYSTNTEGCTGFIVGDHQIATAAHCVYDPSLSKWFNITVSTYNTNGALTGNTLTPVEVHIPSNYDTYYEAKKDYALITVEENLSSYVHFDLGAAYNTSVSNYANVPLYITGCPEEVSGNTNINHYLYSAEGHLTTDYNNLYVLFYNIDTSPGDSGSPIYTITRLYRDGLVSYVYTALGIHVHGDVTFNYGPRITKIQRQFYKNNPYMNY